ncbi:hypothetical protein [Streptosporangium pseudovulgare]|uniref:Uncharacterized protein n=1 Tax=Streptosporangium pseudovulgare TaxID=35765 RepID=A0ABQ2RN88_9ACTN|nr:hypothetical protein [Streptosporangium pseudovulgare]GGQ35887.1 hypothetical protein GCM10010140_77320 [Streptosporangium pseudovulgare]
MSRSKYNDLVQATRRITDALGLDHATAVELAADLEKDGCAGWSGGDLLLLSLSQLIQQRAAAAKPDAPPADATGCPWIVAVHRDRDGQLIEQSSGISWTAALRDVLGALPFGDEPWTLTLRGPQGTGARAEQRGAEARFKTRAGVETAMRAPRWGGVMEAMQQEWADIARSISPTGVFPQIDAEFSRPSLDMAKVRELALSAGIPESELDQAIAEQVSLRHYIVYRTTGADHIEAMLQALEDRPL